jgi:hypothetical protein
MPPRETPSAAKSLADLRDLTDLELVAQHDRLAGHTQVGISYYLEELHRRAVVAQGKRMERLTQVIAVLTVVNVAAVIVGVTCG